MGSASTFLFRNFVVLLLLAGPLTVHSEPENDSSKTTSNNPEPPMAVQGVVYCTPCKCQGRDILFGARPISGVNVQLTCVDQQRPWNKPVNFGAQTDGNGYFIIRTGSICDFRNLQCSVSVDNPSPSPNCEKLTNLHMKDGKATLNYKQPQNPNAQFNIYTVGPFAYEPSKCTPQ